MAKKTDKTNRGERYAAIMEKWGYARNEWRVLSFVFEQESGPELLHFRLLNTVPGPGYYLFDCFDNTANIIVPNNDDNAARIQKLAERCGGKKITPNLR